MIRTWGWYTAGVIIFMLALLLVFFGQKTWPDPLETMRPEERRVLYESNWRNFAKTCEVKPRLSSLDELCRNEAELLRRFPRCDSDCQNRTESFVPARPTR